MAFYTLKVHDKRIETKDTVTLCFKQPGLKKIKYLAGQYLTLVFRINGRRYLRPYSFSSSPGVDSLLEITVKRIPGGIISNHINDAINIGDSIEVMEPMGDFIYQKDKDSSCSCIILWGVGSGITPLISIAKYILSTHSDKKVILLYGNRNHESVIFRDQILHLQQEFINNFTAWHFLTQAVVDESNPSLVQGRINPEKVFANLKQDDLENAVHYICGPPRLKESVKSALNLKGISSDRINTEDFELVKNPKDFVDIHTQLIELTFNNIKTTLEVVKGKSILEAGLDANIELPYSCQTGNCITCKGELLSGTVKTIGIDKFPEGLAQNEYLLCCSYPLSNDVKITIN
ncbi:MAG: ferredoxin--NADP reductase [Sphingobacteriales bacterium]|nr:ferredoxin--NADP reductase [Sphingobacteriales bacterium]